MNYYIGIDIGTSSTKSVVFNSSGVALFDSTYEYELLTPNPSWAEQRPNDWFNATISTLKDIAKKYPTIRGIGLSGQMHGLVILDKDDNVLRNSIIWCDNRTVKEKEEIEKIIGKDKIKSITGNEAMAPFTLAKLLWVKNNEPEIYSKISKVMLPKDYIRYMLTGEFKTEYSDASGMQMVDIYNKCFSKEIINAFGFKEEWFPTIVESYEISGYVKPIIRNLVGFDSNTFVVGGAGDQAAAAIGSGIINPNDISVVLGSSGVVFNPIKKEQINPNLPVQVFMHAIPDTYHIMGVTNGCGLSYKWYKENLCNYEIEKSNRENKPVYEILNEEASLSIPGSNGLLYLPYLNGERTPHNDPYATGVFIGIRQSTTKNDFTRAILEGVAFSLRDCYEMLDKKKYNVYVSGGGAKGKLWREIIASNLKTPLYRIEQSEGGALGVAILAMVAAKEYESIEAACKSIIKIKDSTSPNQTYYEIYDKQYLAFRNCYKSLKDFFKNK